LPKYPVRIHTNTNNKHAYLLDFNSSKKAFFKALMRDIESTLDPWQPAGIHTEEYFKNILFLNL
jgi:hypothetical protein